MSCASSKPNILSILWANYNKYLYTVITPQNVPIHTVSVAPKLTSRTTDPFLCFAYSPKF